MKSRNSGKSSLVRSVSSLTQTTAKHQSSRKGAGQRSSQRHNGLFKRFVTLWVLVSFILSSAPAQASRLDRPDFERGERWQQRLERRQERWELRTPIVATPQTPLVNPVLAPIFQHRPAQQPRLGNLQQPRIARAELATTRQEARQNLREARQQSADQVLRGRTVQALDSGRTRNVNSRLNLDLSSTKDSITLGQNLFDDSSSITVTVGGVEKTFTAGSKATAAEYAAILQSANGEQTLVLDDKGRASGGDLNFETLTANGDNLKLSALVIPEQVAAIGNFSGGSDVRLKGDVTNYGSIYAIANREGGTKASIATDNLTNAEGGLISSVPNSSLGTDLAPNVDLRLRADDTLSNQGKIESSGDLTLSAGSQILNGDARGRASSATVVANGNLNLDAALISNSGTMSATNGSVNISSPSVDGTTSGSINFYNENGTVLALNGDINVRDSSAAGKPVTDITGGDWLSKEFNIDNADGATKVDVKNLTGVLNLHSGTARVLAQSDDLKLGEFVVTGDPTIANTGNINITADVSTNGGPLTYIAGLNILIDPGVTISTANLAGAGGTLLMVAGAEYEDASTPGHPGEDWITGPTGAGGGIYMSTPGGATITSNGTTNAGNIQMIAFPSTDGLTLGEVYIGTSNVTAQGESGGSNGDVTIIARGIDLNSINVRGDGSTAGTGNILLNTLNNAALTAPQVRIDDATGAILSGGFTTGSAAIAPEAITVGNLTAGGTTSLNSGSFISTSAINSTGSTNITAGDNINLFGAITGTSLSAVSGSDIALSADITTPGGILLVASRNVVLLTNVVDLSTSSSTASAGDITIIAGADFDQDATTVTITGASGTGGFIGFDGVNENINNIDSRSTFTNGSGGDVTMVAFNGSDATGFVFTDPTATAIRTGGNGTGLNGNFTAIAGAQSFDGIGIRGLLNTTGGNITTGDVFVATATPVTTPDVVIQKDSAAINAGDFRNGTAASSNLFIDNVTVANGADITLRSGGDVVALALNGGLNSTLTIVSQGATSFTSTNLGTATITAGGDVFAGNILQGVNATATLTVNATGATQVAQITSGRIFLATGTDLFLGGPIQSNSSFSGVAGGFINIDNDITAPAGILLVAGRDITPNSTGVDLIASSATASAGDITLVAGAAFSQTAATVTITGATTQGGSIDFDNIALNTIDARSTFTNGSGGDITMIAFDGAGAANTGVVFTDPATSQIFTGGNGSGANGNFTAIGGASSGSGVGIRGTLSLVGGSASTGDVWIATATPNTTTSVVMQKNSASITAGDFRNGTAQSSNLFLNQVSAANVRLIAGSAFLQSPITATGSLVATAEFDIGIDNDITAPGGILLVAGQDVFTNSFNAVDFSTASAVANGGAFTAIGGASFSQTLTTVTITGASPSGGRVAFGEGLATINTRGTAGNLSGGNINLIAFEGVDFTSGGVYVNRPQGSIITSGGSGSGVNGNVTVVAGELLSTESAIFLDALTTTGGTGGGGNVYLSAATPDTTPNVVISKATAAITTGDFTTTGTNTAGSIFAGDITVAPAAPITVLTNGSAQLGDLVGAGSSLNITGSGGTVSVDLVNTGSVRIIAGLDLFLLDTVTAAGSIAATAVRDIIINNDVTAPGGILLVSGQNIFGNDIGIDLSTASSTTSAGDLSLIAGAAFTQNATTVTVTGASTTGGYIDLAFNNATSITTRSTAANGSGGDINLIALLGGTPGTAQILTATTTAITTGGTGTGANGNVTAVAGNSGGTAIGLLGSLSTVGGTGGAGNVYLSASTPDTTPNVVLSKTSAAITAGDFTTTGTNTTGNIFSGNITVAPNASIDILTNGFAQVGNLVGTNSAIRVSAGSSISVGTVTGNNTSLLAGSFLQLNGTVTAPGGILMVAGGNIFTFFPGLSILSNSATANGGDITIVAGAAFTQNATTVTITGNSATGGFIDFDFNGVANIDSRSTFTNGSGGDVTMVAFNGSADTGFVFNDTDTVIRTGGNGTGFNGNFTAIGSAAGGDGIGIRGTLNTTGGNVTTGDVFIATATPVTTPNVIVQKSSAAITAGDFRNGTATASNVFVDDITVANGADITLRSGGDVVALALVGGLNSNLNIVSQGDTSFTSANLGTAVITAGGDVFAGNILQGVNAAATLTISAGGLAQVAQITSGRVFLSAGSDMFLGGPIQSNSSFSGVAGGFIDIDNDITAPGGILLVAGRDIAINTAGVDLSSNSTTASAGNISIVAGASFTQDATSVTVTGASALGGRMDFDNINLSSLTANSTFAGGSAGDITLLSLFGTANTGEVFTDAATVISANGNGAGSNGDITVVSTKTNGFAGVVINGDITIAGGAAGTGSISLNTSAFNGNVTLSKTTAAVTAGTVTGGAVVNSDVVAGDLTVRGGSITARSGVNVQLGALNVSGNALGAGGTINISSNSANTLVLGGAGANSVTSMNAAGGSTSGNGGAILASNAGTGGVNIAASVNVAATEGNGGTISLLASNGDLSLTGTSTLNASGGTTSATARSGGSITLLGNNVTGTGNISLLANGVSGGTGGNISVTSGIGDLSIGTAAGQIQAQAVGTNGSISFVSNNGGDITVSATGNLTASTVNLQTTGGALVINGAVSGATAVNLLVTGTNTITGTSTISGGVLGITAGTASTTLNTNVTSLLLATNGNVNITETNDLNLLAGTVGAGSLNINVTGDDITVSGNVTANGGITFTTSGAGTVSGAGTLISSGQLSVAGGNGAVNLNTNVNSFTAATTGSIVVNETSGITLNNIVASSLNVTAGNGIAHGTGIIDADTINFAALGGDIGASTDFIQINNGANPVALTASATGNIFINIQGSGTLNLGLTTGNDITLTSLAPITTTADVTAAGDLNITTNVLTNPNDLTAGGSITIQSQPGSGLTINGGAGGTMNASDIDITATFGDLTFTGTQTFNGPTTLTAVATLDATLVIADLAVIHGNDQVTVQANFTDFQGSLTGSPLVFQNNFFTIANSSGDVNLVGDIVFLGQDFAILARDNINITGTLTLIDLSDTTTAGSLTMVAGYNFTPLTGGQLQNGIAYTFEPDDQSTLGGSINLSNADIDLSSTSGNGGRLIAIATTGTNAGTISLGDITTTGNTGGSVTIIGEGGITVGDIDTSGSVADGNIHLAVAVPNVTGGDVVVSNGTASGGSFTSTTLSPGNLVFGDITAANNLVLRGAQAAGNTIAQSGTTLNANTLSVEVGLGTATLDSVANVINTSGNGTITVSNTGALLLNASGNGTFSVSNTGTVQLGTLTSPVDSLTLNVTSDDVITTPVGGINDVANLSLTGVDGVGGTAIILNAPISTYSSLSLTADGGADLVISNLTLTSPIINLTSTQGDVIISNTGALNASTSVSIDAGNSFTVAGNITTQTLALTSADDITNADLTGTIIAPLGTFLTTTAGSIGTDENNRFFTNSSQLMFQAPGGVYIQSTANGPVTILDIDAGTEVFVTAIGPITVNDVVSGNGDIQIVQTGIGTFTVANGANLSSNGGDIILQNLDINKKTGKILIDDNTTIKGSGVTPGVGEVFIALGALPVPPYIDSRKAPKNVVINELAGGQVFLSKKGIDTKKETNITLNALGVDLVFSREGKLSKRSIHVGSNVTITADPPWHVDPARTADDSRNASAFNPLTLSNAPVISLGQSSFATLKQLNTFASANRAHVPSANATLTSIGQLSTISQLTTTRVRRHGDSH